MNAQTILRQAEKENPEIALVLEIARRARELEELVPTQTPSMPPNVAANPVASQGAIFSGHILNHQRNLVP